MSKRDLIQKHSSLFWYTPEGKKESISDSLLVETLLNYGTLILNAARRMLIEVWDGVTPIRQVGLGVAKLTHESSVQMSLFEDPKMEYYREWDRQFDEDRARYEDAKMLAYERKKAPKDDALVFRYPNGELALAAAKKAIKGHPSYRFHRHKLEDGTDCFKVVEENKVLERHIVQK